MKLLARSRRLTAVAALLAVAVTLLAGGSAGAHGRVSQAGLDFVFGGTDEPVITGMRTWLEVRASDTATKEPVTGLDAEGALTLTLREDSHEKTLTLTAVRGSDGAYKAAVWFTEPGKYEAVIKGKNPGGEPFEVSFHKDVEDHTLLFSPEPAKKAEDQAISFKIGEKMAMVNGEEMGLDVPVTIVNGRTMVPIRFISEMMGIPVHWDDATRTVHIGKGAGMAMAPQAGHGGHGGESAPASQPGGEPSKTYTLRMLINGFVGVGGDIEGVQNPVLQAKMGQTVKLMLINGDSLEHDLVNDELEVHSGHVSAEGQMTSATFTAGKAGSFKYYCSVPGHRKAGMEGTIEISQ